MSDETSAKIEEFSLLVALTEDEGLPALLESSLVPLLALLSAKSSDTHNTKLIKVVSHIKKRIQANPGMRLPCAMLAQLVNDPQANQLQLTLALMFLDLGIRNESEEVCLF